MRFLPKMTVVSVGGDGLRELYYALTFPKEEFVGGVTYTCSTLRSLPSSVFKEKGTSARRPSSQTVFRVRQVDRTRLFQDLRG